MRNPAYSIDFAKDLVAPEVWEKLSGQANREAMARWAEEHCRFFHPDGAQRLAIDEDLVALNIAFDQPEFFDKVLADLRSKDTTARARAVRLLNRYVPMGPRGETAEAYDHWWKENQAFAFASDAGDSRWYIDPLAKKRGVSVSEMRGPRRADQ